MAKVHPAIADFLNAASGRLGELIGQEISWRPRAEEDRVAERQWWSCSLTVDSACRFYAGAPGAAWEQLKHNRDAGFSVMVDAIERAAAVRFGSQVRCTDIESCDAPAEASAASIFETSAGAIEISMSSEAVEALGGEAAGEAAVNVEDQAGPMDMLLHVEIPVSVSLGRTKMRMKDLLGLSQGSVVELDQELGDQVEIRVNNCVIAHGEVVAVDGNYGVRIMKMVSNGKGGGGLLSKVV